MVQTTKLGSLFVVSQRYIILRRCVFMIIYSIRCLDKTIKLWKVFEKSLKVVAENNLGDGPVAPTSQLRIPKMAHHDTIVAAVPRRIYANGKRY